jgi:glycosyltransferase involved in cell wall biosynthesis
VEESTRILYVVDTLRLGGIERQATDLCIALKKTAKWEPSVCCVLAKDGPFLDVLQKHGIPVYECKLNRSNLASFPFRFSRLIKNLRTQIVHSHVDSSIPWQVFGSILGSSKGIIFTQHNDGQAWNHKKSARLRMKLYYRLCRPFIHRYTTVSMQTRNNFAGMLNVPENEFEVIYNTVDTAAFNPAPQMRDHARSILGVSSSKYVIGTVGRLSRQKGHIYLVEAAKELTRVDSNVHFVFIGDGPQRSTLETRIRESGLTQFFTLAGGREDVHNFYPAFDCVALPSLSEGFGIALVEAMACGIPIIASNVGGITEVLDNGKCGLLVPSADSESLQKSILKLKENHEISDRLVSNGLARVQECFAAEIGYRRYEKIYKDLLKAKYRETGTDPIG